MDNQKRQPTLEEARNAIQEADAAMAVLFQKRMAAVRDVAAYKKAQGLPVFDPVQEQRVIARNMSHITDDDIRDYYLQFIKYTKELSKQYQENFMREK